MAFISSVVWLRLAFRGAEDRRSNVKMSFKTKLRCGRVDLPSCAWCSRYAALRAVLQECRDEGDHQADTRRSEVASATTRPPYVA
ncbi:unnamed protein product [Miscanthus lutarioriparius]|uniref:Uncharacterized protein n=1 Tax=Miscanthus lutarioriparius TaxID=422564 RepID=A0A811S9G1_9POAL|nr:unnamed protein product [Miscanthus lutarioriparius]